MCQKGLLFSKIQTSLSSAKLVDILSNLKPTCIALSLLPVYNNFKFQVMLRKKIKAKNVPVFLQSKVNHFHAFSS